MLYRWVEPEEGAQLQYVGVYVLKWRPEWGVPSAGFIEEDDPLYQAAADLLEACKAARVNAGKFEEWQATRIGNAYDSLPNNLKFSLEEFGFFDLLANAHALCAQLDDAIAAATRQEEA